jgi:hypothetical protein
MSTQGKKKQQTGIFYDEPVVANSTPDCLIRHVLRGTTILESEGVLVGKTKKTVFRTRLNNLLKYTVAILDFERSFANKACSKDGKKKYKMLIFENVKVDQSTHEGRVTNTGFTISGTFTVKDLKAAKKLLKQESTELADMYSKGLDTEVRYSYLNDCKEVDALSDYSQIVSNSNKYNFCAQALDRNNQIFLATDNFFSYWAAESDDLKNRLFGWFGEYTRREGDNSQVAVDKSQAYVNALANGLSNGVFSRKTLFVVFFGLLKQHNDRQGEKINTRFGLTSAMNGNGLFKKQYVGAIDVGELIRNEKFFVKLPIIYPVFSSKKARLYNDEASRRMVAVMKFPPKEKNFVNRAEMYIQKYQAYYTNILNSSGNVITSFRLSPNGESMIKTKDSSRNSMVTIQGFNYDSLAQVFLATGGSVAVSEEVLRRGVVKSKIKLSGRQ